MLPKLSLSSAYRNDPILDMLLKNAATKQHV